MTTKTGKAPVRLTWQDGQVMVTPENKDIFFISAAKAVEACREADQVEEQFGVFREKLLRPLGEWCGQHAERVSACYIPRPAGHLNVFVVTLSERFDFRLAEDIAALERQLAANGWRVGVSQLPKADDRDLATFFDPEGAIAIHADR